MPPPVITTLAGGLGNQMFQYAAGRALAARLGRPLLIDAAHYAHCPLRQLELACFRAPLDHAPGHARWLRRARHIPLARFLPARLRAVAVTERSQAFQPWPEVPAGSWAFLIGYWQSARYFEEIADVIRDDFTVAAAPTGRNAELLTEIESCEAVAVHVRRGDYVSDPTTARYHGTCGLDYYEAALQHIEGVVSQPRLFVFSDDIPWARANLVFRHPVVFIDHNAGAPGEDIRLMAACRHFVIANSTFSWWGAWLSRQPEAKKIVIAPRRWFLVDDANLDRTPPAWVRLEPTATPSPAPAPAPAPAPTPAQSPTQP